MPETAHLYRLGGDEFTAFLPGTTKEQADAYVEEMRAENKLFKIQDIETSVSYGTSVIEAPSDNVGSLIIAADHAMYNDKDSRKSSRA